MNSVVIFGSIPPPIGGVTKSIENLCNALKSKSISVEIFSKKSLFKRYDIAHIHYSKSWKRFVGLVIGKLIAKKTIFTLHGNKYNDDFFNNLNYKLTDGVIFLNNNVYEKESSKFKNIIVLTSLFKEGINTIKKSTSILKKQENKIYLLIYAYNKVYQDGKDIYGVDFILNNIERLDDNYVIVLLDPNKGYKDDVQSVLKSNFIYLDYKVDFISLLEEIDIYIRPTSTDGNSVAVQEALIIGKQVVASDVIDRGEGVNSFKYNDFEDFMSKLQNGKKENRYVPDSIEKYISFVGKL